MRHVVDALIEFEECRGEISTPKALQLKHINTLTETVWIEATFAPTPLQIFCASGQLIAIPPI